MKAELRRSIFLACVGLLGGFALVVTLYGASELFRNGLGTRSNPGASAPVAALSPVPTDAPAPGAVTPPGKPVADPLQPPGPAAPTQAHTPEPNGREAEADPLAPGFDIIRVEPNGETVIAGRGAPNTTVELLRDNQPVARALVDPSGQFAIVPPALPPGSTEITLRTTGADGQVRQARESVVVVVAADRTTKPLIALTAPDKATVVLSQPDPVVAAGPDAREGAVPPAKANGRPETGATAALDAKAPDANGGPGKAAAAQAARGAKAALPAGARPEAAPLKIVSVEAEEGGRLYVTSQAPPGATVRLYLNDTLVAPGSAGTDGRVAFTIGRGVAPGDYRVRVDQVDPVSGKVKTRSEVTFVVPAPALAAKAGGTARSAAQFSASPNAGAAPNAGTASKTAGAGPSAPALPGARPSTAPPAVAAQPSQTSGTAPGQTRPLAVPEPGRRADATPMQEGPVQASPMQATPPRVDATASAGPNAVPGADPRAVFVAEINTARISRGDSLWQISRRIYGKGTRYTVIYDANQPQIRNPDLIYPGQIFVLPGDGTAAAPQPEKKRG